ncbi:hypothetical protein [Streptosporangium canum]|uniref:hypothetical protein n=1 Tax=Streptosporangium canum TaxID=324952 RepID=UPI0037B1E47F
MSVLRGEAQGDSCDIEHQNGEASGALFHLLGVGDQLRGADVVDEIVDAITA